MFELWIGATSIIGGLLATGVITLFKMWRDIAVIKRDIDALACLLGTKRAIARRQKNGDDS